MVRKALFTFFLLGGGFMTGLTQNQLFQGYIDKYKTLAVSEMERTGIPASIKLAQALLESNAGRSDLAVEGNNHFGIKCGNDWNGKTYKKIDDEHNGLGLPKKSCFRQYRSPEESFIAHSEFLTDPRKESRYGFLFDIRPTDYKEWAKGLKKAGYATSADYPRKLIDLIEKYDLDKLDKMTAAELIADQDGRGKDKKREDLPKPATEKPAPAAAAPFTVDVLNDVRFMVSREDQTVAALAQLAGQSTQELLRYNENLTSGDQVVSAGDRVFLQPKRSSFRGRQQWHTVVQGETLLAISQLYAVSLDKLQERNRLNPGEEPVAGARIKLRGSTVDQAPRSRPKKVEEPKEVPKPTRPVIASNTDEGDRMDIEIEGAKPAPAKPSPPATTPQPATGQKPAPTPPQRPDGASPQRPAPPDDPFGGPATPAKPAEENPVFHVVSSGDTLWSISQRYQTTVDNVKKLNNLSSNQIRSGERLRVK